MAVLAGMFNNGIAGKDYPRKSDEMNWPNGWIPIPVHTVELRSDHVCRVLLLNQILRMIKVKCVQIRYAAFLLSNQITNNKLTLRRILLNKLKKLKLVNLMINEKLLMADRQSISSLYASRSVRKRRVSEQ